MCVYSQGVRGFLNDKVLFPLICLPPYVVLSAAWWLLHGLPLWIENKICRNSCYIRKAKGILKKLLFFFFFVQKFCFTQEHHLLDVTSLHFWEYCGRVTFCSKGMITTEKWGLVNLKPVPAVGLAVVYLANAAAISGLFSLAFAGKAFWPVAELERVFRIPHISCLALGTSLHGPATHCILAVSSLSSALV